MRKLISMLLISIMCISFIGCNDTGVKEIVDITKSKQLTKEEKIEDFEYMFKTIEEAYPFLEVNKRVNNVDWIANKEEYLEKIKNTKNDKEFIEAITQILSELNNDHTHLINSKELYDFFKSGYNQTGLYDFFDDEKVLSRYNSMEGNTQNTKEPMVKKDVIVRDVIDKKIGYIYLPQMYGVYGEITEKDIESDMKIIGDYINKLEDYKALIIDIRGNSGGDDMYWRSIVSKVASDDIESKGYLAFRSDNKIMKDYVDKREIRVDSIDNLPKELLENAPKDIMTDFSEFMESTVVIESDNKSKFKGNIYLLVDDAVYSSSESFSIFCKDSGFATLIGEKTGGDGGGIDPILFDLENSGLIIRMASDMYLTGQGICNEEFKTKPDYEVSDVTRTKNFEDDKCIQKVLELENIKF
ncbi:S41 family peptidase [uncultured Clostridium sp.]|uniref:S41 family peptidase n=1 Tax=uncultured Clostridium sp. TaxID=59620 RepID=UPI0025D31AFF|nr:S41 family peptidase [uncultured Clostridium sp.]MDU4884067.1 S41 family peptidase [Clostridium celatum]MDU7077897.1 S41 family peptidase [Clostridium celatum]